MKKIKIGILTDSDYTPFWAYEMVRMVKELPYVSIDLVVTNNSKLEKRTLFRKIYSRLKIIFAVIYLTLDQKLFRSKIDAFQPRSFKSLLNEAEWVGVTPIMTKYRDRFEEKDIDYIRSFDLDIILCRGFRILSGEILNSSKYGVWSYHHGDNRFNRGRPAIFYETVQSWETIGTIFQILEEELDGGTIIYKSLSGHKSRFIFKNMNAVYWKSSYFFKRCIEDLYQNGWEKFILSKKLLNTDFVYDRPIYFIPTNLKLTKLLISHFWRIIKEFSYHKMFEEKWHIAIAKNKSPGKINLNNFKIIASPNNSFWADPMVINHRNIHLIFFEEYDYTKKKAHISYIELDGKIMNNKSYKANIVLEKEYHLSYPFVFEMNKELYMIPESKENATIDLYKFTDEKKFEYVKTLMNNVRAVDSTIVRYDNYYYLFCNIQPHPESSTYDELHVFYTEDLLNSPLKPHARNPIVSDVRKSRPAGPIFENNNKLIRPAQICVPKYGYGISFSEIIELTPTDYLEREIEKIEPKFKDNIQGIHTYSRNNEFQVIDVALKRLRW